MASVDVVVVSFNSRDTLRDCVEPLSREDDIGVIVVDNASTDGSADSIADLPAVVLRRTVNAGFAAGSNAGWRAGAAPYVLLLNPDARIGPDAVRGLVRALEDHPEAGAVAPRIATAAGTLDHSLRRHAPLTSTFARAFYLHRLFPGSAWADEVIRDGRRYETSGVADWVSGACILLRRSALEALRGLDERFFLYREDADLCRRLWDAGYSVRFDPRFTSVHVGGASAPRGRLLPILAASRIDFARKHRPGLTATLERIGIALGAVTHLATPKGPGVRAGHARTLRVAFARDPRVTALESSGLENVGEPQAEGVDPPPAEISTPS